MDDIWTLVQCSSTFHLHTCTMRHWCLEAFSTQKGCVMLWNASQATTWLCAAHMGVVPTRVTQPPPEFFHVLEIFQRKNSGQRLQIFPKLWTHINQYKLWRSRCVFLAENSSCPANQRYCWFHNILTLIEKKFIPWLSDSFFAFRGGLSQHFSRHSTVSSWGAPASSYLSK